MSLLGTSSFFNFLSRRDRGSPGEDRLPEPVPHPPDFPSPPGFFPTPVSPALVDQQSLINQQVEYARETEQRINRLLGVNRCDRCTEFISRDHLVVNFLGPDHAARNAGILTARRLEIVDLCGLCAEAFFLWVRGEDVPPRSEPQSESSNRRRVNVE